MDAKQLAKELHKPIIKRFPRRKIKVYSIDEIWSTDLIDMSREPIIGPGRFKYKYIFVNIDIFSKFCSCFIIKNKIADTLIECYKKLFVHRKPKFIWFDEESGIMSNKAKKFFAENNVQIYHTYNISENNASSKNPVVERLIRTIKDKVERIRTEKEYLGEKFNLFDVLPKVIEEYNKTQHHTTLISPIEAYKKENEKNLQTRFFQIFDNYNPDQKPQLKVGDKVRIVRYKPLFTKGYKANWTAEIFTIKEVIKSKPITYRLVDSKGEDIIGTFYAQELQHSNFSFPINGVNKE